MRDDEVLAVAVGFGADFVGQRFQRAADFGKGEALAQAVGGARGHRADLQLDPLGAVGDAEAARGRRRSGWGGGRDRVGEEHRVGDPVDRDLVAGGERGQRPAQDRAEQLRRADLDLGRLGDRRAAAARSDLAAGERARESAAGACGFRSPARPRR